MNKTKRFQSPYSNFGVSSRFSSGYSNYEYGGDAGKSEYYQRGWVAGYTAAMNGASCPQIALNVNDLGVSESAQQSATKGATSSQGATNLQQADHKTTTMTNEQIAEYNLGAVDGYNAAKYNVLYAPVNVTVNNEQLGYVTVLGSQMNSGEGKNLYKIGTSLKLNVHPKDGCHFVKWQDGNTQTVRSTTVSASEVENTYHAIFAQDTPNDPDNGGDEPQNSGDEPQNGGYTPSNGGSGGGGYTPSNGGSNGGENTGNTATQQTTGDKVIAFCKQYWWAILIGAVVLYYAFKNDKK